MQQDTADQTCMHGIAHALVAKDVITTAFTLGMSSTPTQLLENFVPSIF